MNLKLLMMINAPRYSFSLAFFGIVLFSATLLLFLSPIYAFEEEVEKSFRKFSQQWINTLYAMEERGKGNLTCKKVKDYYIAEYIGYSRTYSSTIKKTDSKETPYIGILSYKERKFASRAKTFEDALRGPFTIVYEYPVREIFMFSHGEWHY